MRKLLLFVCGGNTCRSPMAAAIAKNYLQKIGSGDVDVRSAGVNVGREGKPMTDVAVKVLTGLRIEVDPLHRSRTLRPDLANEADAIYCMEESHCNKVRAIVRSPTDKVFRLDPGGNIPDPYEKPPEERDAEYAKCAEHLLGCVPTAVDKFLKRNS